MTKTVLCVSLWLLLQPTFVSASPTRSFVLDSASVLSEGKLDGTSIESDGSIQSGVHTRRTELPGVPSAKSLLLLPDGTAFIGTGNDGRIYAYRAGAVRVFAETKQLMVSSLTRDAQGTLYAGTLPSGKIFAISSSGQVREFAAPAHAEHIWALAYDERRKTLFAATGPEGKLFAIDAKGKADVYYDSDDAHIMALALADDGSLYIGTSDRALVLRVLSAGRADVIYDFEGNEITGVALRGEQLAVIANNFPKPAAPPKPLIAAAASDGHGTTIALTPAPTLDRPQAGKGVLYRVTVSGQVGQVGQVGGQVERLFSADEGHLTTVNWLDDDTLYVGTGKEGHIHRVRASDHSHSLLVDVDERQVLALQRTAAHAVFVTGDGAAVYELDPAARELREWTSKVLDAAGHARFGRLSVRGHGPVAVRTRSGNTDKPDNTWSPWSQPLSAQHTIQSPSARFLQIKVQLDEPGSVVYALEAFYLPDNQAALVTEVSAEAPRARVERAGNMRSGPSSSVYKLRWKLDNPDNDSLRYRLYSTHEGDAQRLPLLRESVVLTDSEYSWDTDAVPDGYYRIHVEASDELDNPEPLVRKGHGDSEPFLVDNRPPELPELRVEAQRVVGKALDALGPITRLEYNVDGLEWRLVRSDDDLLDSREERFAIPLSQLPKGQHLLAVRASDARGNTVTRNVAVNVP
ncbi:MAG: hypothetical protein RL701_3622 [Pseudomonadota bacterium]